MEKRRRWKKERGKVGRGRGGGEGGSIAWFFIAFKQIAWFCKAFKQMAWYSRLSNRWHWYSKLSSKWHGMAFQSFQKDSLDFKKLFQGWPDL